MMISDSGLLFWASL